MSGTYIGLRTCRQTAINIKEYCKNQKIHYHVPNVEDRLHVTLIYSRKAFNFIPDPHINHTAKFSGFDTFNTDRGTVALVAKIDAPSIRDRHLHIKSKFGATHDYPEYIPHLTLSYNWDKSRNLDTLPIINFPIILQNEYCEPLIEKWN